LKKAGLENRPFSCKDVTIPSVKTDRRPRGERAPWSKLKLWQVKKIRRDRTSKLRELAAEFGVSIPAIWSIKAGRNWK